MNKNGIFLRFNMLSFTKTFFPNKYTSCCHSSCVRLDRHTDYVRLKSLRLNENS